MAEVLEKVKAKDMARAIQKLAQAGIAQEEAIQQYEKQLRELNRLQRPAEKEEGR